MCLVEPSGKIPVKEGRNLHVPSKRDEGELVGAGDEGTGDWV